jgi:hypothetical protein
LVNSTNKTGDTAPEKTAELDRDAEALSETEQSDGKRGRLGRLQPLDLNDVERELARFVITKSVKT